MRRDPEHQPVAVKDFALALPVSAWETITWREGSAGPLTSQFARQRVRAAHRDPPLKQQRPEEWLLVEWPDDKEQPAKYWLSTLPEDKSFSDLVEATKLRWRIERDDQDLKQKVGLSHYEGRGWRGFHRHATLCIAAYAFLIAERSALPPSGRFRARKRPQVALPPRGRPRAAAAASSAARGNLDRYHATAPQRRPRQHPQPPSLLPRTSTQTQTLPVLVTQ